MMTSGRSPRHVIADITRIDESACHSGRYAEEGGLSDEDL
jgi:hypothetical protein